MQRLYEHESQRIEILRKEVPVFEETKQRKVEHHAQDQIPFRLIAVIFPGISDRPSEQPVDDDRGDHDQYIDRFTPAVEKQAYDQKYKIAPAHRHKKIDRKNDREIGV